LHKQAMHAALISDKRYQNASLGGQDLYAGSVRGHLWQSDVTLSKGQIRQRFVILPGFTEFCEKYAHVAQKMVNLGHDCLIIDWPGQGRSGHLGSQPLMVHCERFSGHIDALDQLLVAAGWRQKPFHFLAHSMGGHLALLSSQRFAKQLQTIALSAPMILPRPRPIWAIRLLGLVLGACGFNRHYTPLTTIPSVESLQQFDERNLLTTDEAGYLWQTYWFFEMPELRRYGASVGWVREAYRSAAYAVANPAFLKDTKTPVLIMMAEKEQVVSNSKMSYAASHLPNADLIEIKGAKHELFNETSKIDDDVWDHLTRFWDRHI